MSNNEFQKERLTLGEEELDHVVGGQSDRSLACGETIGTHCFFCSYQKHGQFIFSCGTVKDTIGCSLYGTPPAGSIDGWILADSVPVQCNT
ncbi:MAG: hypothetical protein LBC71_06915 [Oscillospiraceae bacterium]|jgi:hypothetical protein|nr:hypothetical protein [Oscillospiraceae bacterium]MDR2600315.1 hypothetical protein [Oscillospiraceae bacterium]